MIKYNNRIRFLQMGEGNKLVAVAFNLPKAAWDVPKLRKNTSYISKSQDGQIKKSKYNYI